MRKLWGRLNKPTRVALVIGLILAVAAIPLPTLLALVVGLGAAGVLGFVYPANATGVGIAVALPILLVAFIAGFVRGFSAIVLIIFLTCSLILPVGLARMGAATRSGRPAAATGGND